MKPNPNDRKRVCTAEEARRLLQDLKVLYQKLPRSKRITVENFLRMQREHKA